jgi:hypothetical protein
MIMVTIREGAEPQKVPLAYYDENGERHVVGKAAVQIKNGEMIALGQLSADSIDLISQGFGGLNLEGFSLSVGPLNRSDPEAAFVIPAVDAAQRLGPLSRGDRAHATDSNPNGQVRQCDRRDLHEPHEWQAEFGAYFNVFCPGNTGSRR